MDVTSLPELCWVLLQLISTGAHIYQRHQTRHITGRQQSIYASWVKGHYWLGSSHFPLQQSLLCVIANPPHAMSAHTSNSNFLMFHIFNLWNSVKRIIFILFSFIHLKAQENRHHSYVMKQCLSTTKCL